MEQNGERKVIYIYRGCPWCKRELELIHGKYGDFYGCKNYPRCIYTVSAKKAKKDDWRRK